MQKENGQQDIEGKEPSEKQVVYMMPAQDLDEDEIDLWQLILPIIRYKVQIILFLIAGLVIGFGYPHFQARNQKPSQFVLRDAPIYESELRKLVNRQETLESRILNHINSIPEGDRLLQIEAAEFLYTIQDNPNRIHTISFNSFAGLNQNSLRYLPQNIDLILTVNRTSVVELKHKLRHTYEKLFDVTRHLADLDKQHHIQMIENLKNPQEKNKPAKSQPLVNQEQKSLQYQRDIQKSLLQEIQNYHFSLSERIDIEVESNKIPWKLLQIYKSQKDTDTSGKAAQDGIINLSNELLRLNERISRTQFLLQLTQEDSSTQDILMDSPAFQKFKPAVTKARRTVSSKKILLISVIIALFLGVLSVYVRIFMAQIGQRENTGKYKQEFVDALKSWKL